MSKNYIKEVAHLLGVELGEEFNIKDDGLNPHYFTETNLYACDNLVSPKTLIGLLNGSLVIEKPILNEKERRYLASVIAPKQIYDGVKYIVKTSDGESSFILIKINNESICFPYFNAKNMYKGMEDDKRYTLKELGLSRDE